MKSKIKKPDYEEGFNILYEYFDFIPEEERTEVHEKLENCGL